MTDTTASAPAELDLYAAFGSDTSLEEDGFWWDLNGTTKFKIRAFSAKIVNDRREKELKPFQQMIRAGVDIPEDKDKEIGLKVIAGAVIADWAGVVIAGEVVPYSEANALILLKALARLANLIARQSASAENYRVELREDGVKN